MDTLLVTARRGHRALYLFAAATAVLSAVLIVLTLVDDRTVLGQPVWAKPLKFSLSFALYAGALAFLLGRLPRVSRMANVAAWVVTLSSLTELVLIVGQAARGTRSHFNEDTAFDGLLWALMGVAAGLLYLGAVVVALSIARHPETDPALGLAVRSGLVLTLLGMAVGFVMVLHGAHAVGVPDGGAGLPFVGWSSTGGDLRIGHFVGLHALQILPLTAAALGRFSRWDGPTRLAVVRVTAATYAALLAFVTWQALRAEPLLSPDALSLGVLTGIVICATLATRRALMITSRVLV